VELPECQIVQEAARFVPAELHLQQVFELCSRWHFRQRLPELLALGWVEIAEVR
jgi:hypothetical protein